MGGRRRNIFVLLFVLGLVIVSAVICLKKPTQLGLDLQGGIELTLQGRPTPQVKEVTSEAMDRSVDIIRSGCDKLGVSDRLELALYCLHHELLKHYAKEIESLATAQVQPMQPLRAKM